MRDPPRANPHFRQLGFLHRNEPHQLRTRIPDAQVKQGQAVYASFTDLDLIHNLHVPGP